MTKPTRRKFLARTAGLAAAPLLAALPVAAATARTVDPPKPEPPALLFGYPLFIDDRQVTIRPDGSWRGMDGRPFDAD